MLSRDKFDAYASIEDRRQFVRQVLRVTNMVPVLSEITDCRDETDNKYLALALDSECAHILTGDTDLLELNPWRNIGIVSPAVFLSSNLTTR